MSTKKRRIATYIPTEIEDKFQTFKKEREVGDSQALILILTEFLGVSQKVAFSSESLKEIKSELLSELRSELLKEVSLIEKRLSKKTDEPESEPPKKSLPKIADKVLGQKELNISVAEAAGSSDFHKKGLTGKALAERLRCDDSELSKVARGKTKENLADFSKKRDPDGIAWKRRDDKRYYPLPASLSEGEAEARSSHPKGLAF
jgi:hypothetical protein